MITADAPGAESAEAPRNRDWRATTVPAVALGFLAGLFALSLATMELRWTLYGALAACFGATLLLAKNVRLYLLGLFILCLQANLELAWMMQRMPSVGTSGPLAINLPVSVMTASLLLLHHLLTRDRSQPFVLWDSRISRPALLLFVTAVISLIHSPERIIGMFFLIYLVELYLLFITVINTVRTESDLAFVSNLLLVNLLVQSLVYFVENATGATFTLTGEIFAQQGELQRHGGTISTNSLAYGKFITPLLLVAMSRYLTAPDRRSKRWPGLVMLLGTAALILTFGRSVWAGVILGAAALLVTGYRARLVRMRTVIAMLAGSGVVIAILLPMIMIRLGANHSADYSERRALMVMALNMIKAHPFVGVGAGAYPYVVRHYIPYELRDAWLFIVHNVYLLRGAELGIPGLIALVWLLVAATREAFRGGRARDRRVAAMGLGVGAGLLGMMWEKYWDSGACFPNDALLFVLFGLTVTIGRIARADPRDALSEAGESRRVGRIAAPLPPPRIVG